MINTKPLESYCLPWKRGTKDTKMYYINTRHDKEKDIILNLYLNENKNMQEIADIFKVTREAIRVRLKEYGIKTDDKTRNDHLYHYYVIDNFIKIKNKLIEEHTIQVKHIFIELNIPVKYVSRFKRENVNLLLSIKSIPSLQRKLSINLRNRVNRALENNQKFGETLEILGCSIDEFKQYLESKFDDKMSWSNYGSYWEIDHIKPCILFNLSNPQQQKECFHYSNMQPLEVSENRRKNDFYIGT